MGPAGRLPDVRPRGRACEGGWLRPSLTPLWVMGGSCPRPWEGGWGQAHPCGRQIRALETPEPAARERGCGRGEGTSLRTVERRNRWVHWTETSSVRSLEMVCCCQRHWPLRRPQVRPPSPALGTQLLGQSVCARAAAAPDAGLRAVCSCLRGFGAPGNPQPPLDHSEFPFLLWRGRGLGACVQAAPWPRGLCGRGGPAGGPRTWVRADRSVAAGTPTDGRPHCAPSRV